MKDNQAVVDVPTIRMGRSRSSHFPIIKTQTGIELTVNEAVRCLNPKTNQLTTGIVTKHYWTIDWDDLPEWAEALILWGWGIAPMLFRKALIAYDEGFIDQFAIIVLIRETN